MKSMTGYGRAREQLDGKTITVELRAVNHRYLDSRSRRRVSTAFWMKQ